MLLNRIERAITNSPVRAGVQRRFEASLLLELGGAIPGRTALEVGCGRGVGVETIIRRFGATRVDAFDLDPRMVGEATQRLAQYGDRVRLWVGDATAIPMPAASYDAVFDFHIIHHVPDWRRAVAEVYRVLRPGGRLFAGEVLEHVILHPVWRRLLEHPLEDRFDANGFIAGLQAAGFVNLAVRRLWKHLVWVVADRPATAAG